MLNKQDCSTSSSRMFFFRVTTSSFKFLSQFSTSAAAMIGFCDDFDKSLKSYLLFRTFVGHHFGDFRDGSFRVRVDLPLDFLQLPNGSFQLKNEKNSDQSMM